MVFVILLSPHFNVERGHYEDASLTQNLFRTVPFLLLLNLYLALKTGGTIELLAIFSPLRLNELLDVPYGSPLKLASSVQRP
jgi:hypothetical protein